MTTVRLTLQPASAFGTPLLGEILFGQMCWAFVRLYGEERLADLLEGYVDGRPFAVLSDAFPSGHVPLPTLPNYLWQDPASADMKYLKKKAWLPISALREAPHRWQQLALTDREVLEGGLRTTASVAHNTINRMTMKTGTGQFAPYLKTQTWYNTGLPLEIYAVIDETRTSGEEIRAALEYVGLSGYGRDASIGLGKFTIAETHVPCDPEPTSRSRLALSSCVLAGEHGIDAERTFYRIRTHFGRHGDRMALTGKPFKRPVLAASAGAVLTYETKHDRPFAGQGIAGISPSQPEAVHQGYSPVLALTACF